MISKVYRYKAKILIESFFVFKYVVKTIEI